MTTNLEKRLEQIEQELTEANNRIDTLLQWKASCNMLMAWWGGVCMAGLTLGSAMIHYYQDIKAYLLTLWVVK